MQDANQSKFELDVTTVDIPLQVYEFTGEEKIGESYQFEITFICEDPDLILEQWLQLPARLSICGDNVNSDSNTRFVHGVIQSMEQMSTSFRFSTYRLSLVPVFSLLSLRHNYQMFQQKPVHEIISEVYSQAGILNHHYDIELHHTHENRDYCVQYGETDAQFVQRLMSEEGLISYFEHTESQSKLIISDGKETHTNLPELEFIPENGMVQESDVIYSLAKEQNIQTGKYAIKDYVFQQPKQMINAEKSTEKVEDTASEEALECYDYQALNQANLYLERKRTNQIVLRGESDSPQLTPGYFQPISNHPIEEWNTNWLITSVNYEGRQPQVLEELAEGTSHFESRFHCIPWSVPYRLAKIEKPRIHNIDTAIVTGPENEEIYCDEYGRVKVQFHWDRNGQADEKTSCWLRTSQGWAGNQYGQFVLPRIGHEVIVSFIQGDPDKPIITGSLYNGDNKPPYPLPEHKTRSTFKTSSSIGADNFNELRFDDKNASEQIYIHAAKDMDSQIQNNRTNEIFNDDHSVVHHDQFHQVTKDNYLTVQSDNLSSIKGDAHQQVSGSVQQKIQGSRLEQIGTELHIKVGNKAVLDAGSELTITTGSSTMKLDSGGIHLLGAAIDLNKGGSPGSGSGYAGITATQPIMKQSETAGSAAEIATASEYTRSKINAAHQIEALKTSDPVCEECEQEQEQE
ncbi:VgrG protein [Aliivibrio fischeri ES114]|uniref:VgrG protein n=1 Tax=Aliivibrio fischeri (strain ATCC 700601 / ES114) TaxID=312309 RepID=Q5E5H2_ALIF1|nr:type VI secretion system tip protein TssI/VgrG [Aliivibrio fischeri]AAW85724.1 VgrG protein [Aliivibrio fischeri ES114]KLU80006.1 type VI secretion protein VgrG [Aliivibrio fischeri]